LSELRPLNELRANVWKHRVDVRMTRPNARLVTAICDRRVRHESASITRMYARDQGMPGSTAVCSQESLRQLFMERTETCDLSCCRLHRQFRMAAALAHG
jgi:hypothetical protein